MGNGWENRRRIWETSKFRNQVASNVNYIRGRGFEYRTAAKLRKHGFVVSRVFGSFGPYDLHASRGSVTWLIQCKWSKSGLTKPDSYDLRELIRIAAEHRVIPIFAGISDRRIYFIDLRSGGPIDSKNES